MQNADITFDEWIKKGCHQKINKIYLATYLGLPTYQMARLNWNIYIIFDGIYDYKPNHGCNHICHVLA